MNCPLLIGSVYIAKNTNLLRDHGGILQGSEWVVTCVMNDKISLSCRAKNDGGYTKMTVAKDCFGVNFDADLHWVNLSQAYAMDAHFYPNFDVVKIKIFSFKNLNTKN